MKNGAKKHTKIENTALAVENTALAVEQATPKEEIVLTEQEVWDVLKFARSLSGGPFGMLTPDMINSRMKDITLNPLVATQELLDNAFAHPKEYESQLRAFSQSFEVSSMVYKRILAYLSNMLAFDITYTAKNADAEDYKTPKYKKDLAAFETFLDKFEYKKELRIVVREMLRNDAYFGCFVDTGDRYVLQELPPDYCKITGRWEGGFLFSFDMEWFSQPGVDINMYPAFFKKKYNETWKSKKKYVPSISPELRAQSGWANWVDVPVTLGVCFKLSPELSTRLPYFTPLFNDLILQATMRTLQKNMNMAAASKMIIGEVPMLNKDAKATVKDSIAVSPELLGKFLALVKSAISESIKVASAPLQDMKAISFDGDNDMYDKYLRTALASSGVNTNLIFTSNVKPNAIETQLSLNVDEQMMTTLYEQFEDFMNYFANKHTKSFKFKLNFEGTDFFLDREQRMEKVMGLFDSGIVLPQKIAAAMGMKPADFRKHMEEAGATNFMGTLTPPTVEEQKQMIKVNPSLAAMPSKAKPGSNTSSEKPAKRGRPKKRVSELGEEGMKTRETGGNIGRGGKV